MVVRGSKSWPHGAVAAAALCVLWGSALTAPGWAQSEGPPAAARLEVRLQQLEGQVRNLTGQVERLSYQLRQLERDYERSQADLEMRLGAGPAPGDTSEGDRAGDSGPVVITPGGPPGSSLASADGGEPAEADEEDGRASGSTAARTPTVTGPSGSSAQPTVLPRGAPAEDYNNAYALLLEADYAGAQRAFQAFLENHPDDPLAGNAQYWLGETYYVRENYQQSAIHFAEGYQNYPEGPKAPANLLKLGMSLSRLGKTGEACASFAELERKFPDAPGNVRQYARTEQQRIGC